MRDEPAPPESRWGTSGMAPRQVGAAGGYSATPAGPILFAPVTLAGNMLGWVWTDQQQAAGWRPAEPSEAVPAGLIARAHTHAYKRLATLHTEGVPAAEVLNSHHWQPYTLGTPRTVSHPAGHRPNGCGRARPVGAVAWGIVVHTLVRCGR